MVCHFLRIFQVSRVPVLSLRQLSSTMAFENVKNVDIDPNGVFKYILIKVYGNEDKKGDSKIIVRGYGRCAYHADIYEEVQKNELTPGKLVSDCLGGGRIHHDAAGKKLKVYGYSVGFGKADHTIAVDLLEKTYPDYNITWTDEGY